MNPVSPSETASRSLNVMPSPKPDAESAPGTETKCASETDIKQAYENIPKPALESDSKPVLESDSKPVLESDSKPALKSYSKPALESDSKPGPESEPKPVVESDPKPFPPGFFLGLLNLGFYPKSVPRGFDSKQAPNGFDSKQAPNGFDSKQAPNGFDSKQAPNGFDSKPEPNGFDSKPDPLGFHRFPVPLGFDSKRDPLGFHRFPVPLGFASWSHREPALFESLREPALPESLRGPAPLEFLRGPAPLGLHRGPAPLGFHSEPSETIRDFLTAEGTSVYDRFLATREQISLSQKMPMVHDLASPVYVFVADLVQYVTRYHSNESTEEWDFNHEFTHTSTSTHFNYKVQNAVDAWCFNRQTSIYLMYNQCFPKGCPSELHFHITTKVLKGAVSTKVVKTFLQLIEFCFFVAQFSAFTYGSGLISAPYRALDIIHSNVLEFLRRRCNGQTELPWDVLVPACRVIEFQVEDRSLFKILRNLLTQRGEDVNWAIGLESLSLSD